MNLNPRWRFVRPTRPPRARVRVGVLAGLLVLTAGCDAIPEHALEQGRRRRLEALGVETFDSTGSKLAGMSATQRVEVERLNRRSLGGDTLSPEFKTFLARCGACHDVPHPGSKKAHERRWTLKNKSNHQEKAGLLPMSPQQKGAVLEYLERHAR